MTSSAYPLPPAPSPSIPFLTQRIAVFFPPVLSFHINTAVTVSQGRGLGLGAVQLATVHTQMNKTEPGVITDGLQRIWPVNSVIQLFCYIYPVAVLATSSVLCWKSPLYDYLQGIPHTHIVPLLYCVYSYHFLLADCVIVHCSRLCTSLTLIFSLSNNPVLTAFLREWKCLSRKLQGSTLW